MPKLIDAEAAKAAIQQEIDSITRLIDLGGHPPHYVDGWLAQIAGLSRAARALDALPDASEKAIHAERIPVPPHLAEAQRVVIRQAQQAGDGAEEK